MSRVRKELGADAMILSNRRLDGQRIEIIAAAPDEMRSLVEDLQTVEPSARDAGAPVARAALARGAAARFTPVPIPRRSAPEPFAEFIRRQARPRPATGDDAVAMYASVARSSAKPPAAPSAAPAGVAAAAPAAVPDAVPDAVPAAVPVAAAPAPEPAAVFRRRPSRLQPQADRRSPVLQRREPSLDLPARVPPAGEVAPAEAPRPDPVMAELRALRSSLSERIAHLESDVVARARAHGAGHSAAAFADHAVAVTAPAGAPATSLPRPAPVRAAMTRLLMSGFSPELARRVGAQVPQDLDAEGAARWLQSAIAQEIRCPGEAENPLHTPGAIALTGPTGVGKTTTIAKLAARWVVRHGAVGLGLVTLDSYRMGAHEQLRSYGRILGVAVHSAQDASTLEDLMRSLRDKRLVLIDTCGMSQRDARLSDMLAMLDAARWNDQKIRRVLLLNAASHAETLDEVSRGWQIGSAEGCVLTKIDEAARIGGALDSLIRYRAPLLGLTNGQRVPEDWHAGNAPLLAHLALKPFGASFCLEPGDVQALSSEAEARVAHA